MRLPISTFGDVLGLLNSRPLFNADYVALTGGNISAWIDWNNPAHTLAQSNGASQAATPAAHADFGGKLCATFTGGQYYDSSNPASYWLYENSGDGAGCYAALTPTDVSSTSYFASSRGASGAGLVLSLSSAPQYVAQIFTSLGSTVVSYGAGVPAANTPVLWLFQFETRQNPGATIKVTGTAASTVNAVASLTAVPPVTMRVGARASTGLSGINARVRSVMFPPYLDGAPLAAVQSYLTTDTGLAA